MPTKMHRKVAKDGRSARLAGKVSEHDCKHHSVSDVPTSHYFKDAPVRTADNKGRISLGQKFADVTFTVRQGADRTEIVLIASRVIPEREIWLYQNPQALGMVMNGLAAAKEGKFSDRPPDLEKDCQIVEGCDEE